jgi:hypothetical protein
VPCIPSRSHALRLLIFGVHSLLVVAWVSRSFAPQAFKAADKKEMLQSMARQVCVRMECTCAPFRCPRLKYRLLF